MKYPSVYLSQLADWLETYEPHEKIEALADKVEDLEQPVETRLDWLYERLTAYRRLQEVQRELEQVKSDRLLLSQEYAQLYRHHRQQTGEAPGISSPEVLRAIRRAGIDAIRHPAVKRLARLVDDLRYKTRG